MTQRMKIGIKTIGLIGGGVAGVSMIFTAATYALSIPQKVLQHERDIIELKKDQVTNRELLVRIEERLKNVQERMNKGKINE